MNGFGCHLIAVVALGCAPFVVAAAPARVDVPSSAQTVDYEARDRAQLAPYLKSVEWLQKPDVAAKAQHELFAELQQKTGGAVPEVPAVERGHALQWQQMRHAKAYTTSIDKDGHVVITPPGVPWTLIYEDLVMARAWLAHPDIADQRAALVVAQSDALLLSSVLHEPHVVNLIYQGFLLPHLAILHAQPNLAMSQASILQRGAGALADDNQREKAMEISRRLIRYGEGFADARYNSSVADNARFLLALLLRAQGDLQGAVQVLRQITGFGLTPLAQSVANQIQDQIKNTPTK